MIGIRHFALGRMQWAYIAGRGLLTISQRGTPRQHEPVDLTDTVWSGRRDSNPRPQPWQGCALPLSYARAPARARVLSGFPRLCKAAAPTLDATPGRRHGQPNQCRACSAGTAATSMGRASPTRIARQWTTSSVKPHRPRRPRPSAAAHDRRRRPEDLHAGRDRGVAHASPSWSISGPPGAAPASSSRRRWRRWCAPPAGG